MQLTTKGRYAVMAMADLAYQARQTENAPVALSGISERQEISLAYLEQLFLKMRKAGIVESIRGPGGGYRMSRTAEDIMILDILAAVEEPVKIVRCTGDEGTETGCVGGEQCLTHGLWATMGRHLVGFLKNVSIQDVIDGKLDVDNGSEIPVLGVAL